jgi:hypothetical protein
MQSMSTPNYLKLFVCDTKIVALNGYCYRKTLEDPSWVKVMHNAVEVKWLSKEGRSNVGQLTNQ